MEKRRIFHEGDIEWPLGTWERTQQINHCRHGI